MIIQHKNNPAPLLERIYNLTLQQKMQGLRLCNDALSVEAVGFHKYDGHWMGILITPWFLNLMIIPSADEPWPDLIPGKGNEIAINFPSGHYKFSPRNEPEIGSYLCCSLSSPLPEWNNQLEIRETAEAILQQLVSLPIKDLNEPQDPSKRQLFGGGGCDKSL